MKMLVGSQTIKVAKVASRALKLGYSNAKHSVIKKVFVEGANNAVKPDTTGVVNNDIKQDAIEVFDMGPVCECFFSVDAIAASGIRGHDGASDSHSALGTNDAKSTSVSEDEFTTNTEVTEVTEALSGPDSTGDDQVEVTEDDGENIVSITHTYISKKKQANIFPQDEM